MDKYILLAIILMLTYLAFNSDVIRAEGFQELFNRSQESIGEREEVSDEDKVKRMATGQLFMETITKGRYSEAARKELKLRVTADEVTKGSVTIDLEGRPSYRLIFDIKEINIK